MTLRPIGALLLLPLLGACGDPAPPVEPEPGPVAGEPAPGEQADERQADERQADEEAAGEALRLHVPPEQIHGARREAAGLYQLPRALRAQTLATRRAQPAPSYAELRVDADAHARERVSFTGRVGLVRSAGPRLWILALHTRQDGDRWLDPVYVLCPIPPLLPHDGGAIATIDGWVVGERTIGEHALPLLVAYYVERRDGEPE